MWKGFKTSDPQGPLLYVNRVAICIGFYEEFNGYLYGIASRATYCSSPVTGVHIS